MATGGKRKRSWVKESTSLSTPQIKEIASQLSHHPQIQEFFRSHAKNVDQGDGTSVFTFACEVKTMRELGKVVAAAHQQTLPLAEGCSAAVALALCALPCGNHFSKLKVEVQRNSASAPFLAILADTDTCVLEALTFGDHTQDWFRRKAEWSLLADLILHNTTLKTLRFGGKMHMSEKFGIALADSIRNNRGLEELWIHGTDAFGKEGGGLALAAMLRHNSTLRTLELVSVPLCSGGTEALAKALLHNTTLKSLRLGGKMREEGGIALADSIRNNRGLQALRIEDTNAFGKEGGGLALAAMVRHNSTLRILKLSEVPLCSRGTEALAKALGANPSLRGLNIYGENVLFGSAFAGLLSDCVLETLELHVDPPAADAMIKLLTTSKPGHAGVSAASSANICHTLRILTLRLPLGNRNGMDDGMDAATAADMIRSNQKLVSFNLQSATYSSLEWADTICNLLQP